MNFLINLSWLQTKRHLLAKYQHYRRLKVLMKRFEMEIWDNSYDKDIEETLIPLIKAEKYREARQFVESLQKRRRKMKYKDT